MATIQLARVPEIQQGAGALDGLGAALAGRLAPASAVLLVADPGLGPSGFIDSAARSLQAA